MTIAAGQKIRASEFNSALSAITSTTMTKIGSQLVASGTLSALTVSITGTWSALRVHWVGRSDDASTAKGCNLTFNGDSSAHYLWIQSEAANTVNTSSVPGALASAIHIGTMPAASATAGYFGHGVFSVGDPNGSNNKVAIAEASGYTTLTDVRLGVYGGQWTGTPGNAAITSLTLTPAAGNFIAGSKLVVYGLP
jgi:hypothetical protein